MSQRKRHTAEQIVKKLRDADDLTATRSKVKTKYENALPTYRGMKRRITGGILI